MNRFLLAALALLLATGVEARALFITTTPYSANSATGITRIAEVVQGMSTTLGGAYDVANLVDAPQGGTDALRRGTWVTNRRGHRHPAS